MDGSYSIVIDGERFDVEVRGLPGAPGERRFQVRIGENEHVVSVPTGGEAQEPRRPDLVSIPSPKAGPVEPARPRLGGNDKQGSTSGKVVGAPMTGKIVSIHVTEGQEVKEGDLLIVLEAMKMENSILATEGGVVSGIAVNVGDSVRKGAELCSLALAG